MYKTLTIVSTALNEESNIDSFIKNYYKLQDILGYHLRMVIVNNGSTDTTYDMLKTYAVKDTNIKLIDNPKGNGYGDGISLAIREAETPYVLLYPSDLQYSPEDAAKVVYAYSESFSEFELHNSVLTFRTIRSDSIYNRIRGRFWRWITHSYLNLPRNCDPASQLKLLCRDCSIVIHESSFIWDVIQTKKAVQNCRQTIVIPVRLHARKSGKSSINVSPLKSEIFAMKKLVEVRKVFTSRNEINRINNCQKGNLP